MNTSNPVTTVAGIGTANAKKLAHLGVFKIGDLLEHFPFRYEDYSTVSKIKSLRPGSSAVIRARIASKNARRSFRLRKIVLEALATDDTGSIKIVWFNQPYLEKTLKQGEEYFFSGPVVVYDHLQMQNPIMEKTNGNTVYAGRIVPVYPLTQGLSQHWLRKTIKRVASPLPDIPDPLPAKIISEQKLMPYKQALAQIHFPDSSLSAQKARQRLAFEELFYYQVGVVKLKEKRKKLQAVSAAFHKNPTENFVKNLPFQLTESQKRCAWAIIQDMSHPYPMRRLLVGDVGSGKTVVAALAALQAVVSGGAVAIMAPTEILAQQHFRTFSSYPFFKDKKIALLTSQSSALYDNGIVQKNSACKLRKLILSDKIPIIIGTHALIQKNIELSRLTLAVIDEQHRFGVNQRALLQTRNTELSTLPHFLSITATPIPRTLALTVYGDLDISRIDSLPTGRKKIVTKLFTGQDRNEAYGKALGEIKSGRQVFVVCPLIDPSDKLGVKSVTAEYERLRAHVFPRAKLGLLHGKLKNQDKEKVIQDFKNGCLNVLIATTVVEVGVDFPNATVMLIENAERFGLAQLHQLRGRVGRSDKQSYCFLLTDQPTDTSLKRLNAMTEHHSGAELAELDLKLRGPGDLYGDLQSGYVEFKIADIFDIELLTAAASAAKEFINTYQPGLNPAFDAKISEFLQNTHGE